MRIGIKYCGGCNPRYDRTAIVSALREEFPDAELAEAGWSGEVDLVVVICGCGSECAEHELLGGRLGKIVISRAGDYGKLLSLLAGEPREQGEADGLAKDLRGTIDYGRGGRKED